MPILHSAAGPQPMFLPVNVNVNVSEIGLRHEA
jgi:hypothetical protein